MTELDRALQSVRLFLEDAEPWAQRYHWDPSSLQGPDLHQATDKIATSVLNALVLLRGLQPSGRVFDRRSVPPSAESAVSVQTRH